MRRVITKIACYTALALFMAIIFKGSPAFCIEMMDETFSKDMMEGATVVGGEFVKFDTGEEGWRAKTATEPLSDGSEPNYIEYNIEDFNHITEGTIEFWVQRNRGGGKIYKRLDNKLETYDTVFELLDYDNASSFSCMIMWLYADNEEESALYFNYPDYSGAKNYEPVWGIVVPMGIKPEIGDWVHIALVFGENPAEDNKVYINGVLQTRRKDLVYGKAMGNGAALFSDRLSKSNRLRIGIETGWASAYPGGTSLLYHSVISNFVVHDEMLTEFDIDRFIFAGRPSGLKAEYTDDHVVLSWKAGKSDYIEGYNIYKKDAYKGDYVKVNEELVADVTFEDAGIVEGKSYKYVVKGVDRDGTESNASNEAAITIVSEFYRVTEVSREYDPRNLSAVFEDGKITITWAAPSGLTPSGYNVYKRSGEGAAKFSKLNTAPVTATSYVDTDITSGGIYYYSVTSLDADGNEGKYPVEIRIEASATAISSVSVDPARAVKAGDEVTVTVRGTPGKNAVFTVAGVADNVAMKETADGVYYGSFSAGGTSVNNAAVTVTLGDVSKKALATVTVDNDVPSSIIGLDIRNDWENELNIDWQPATESDFKQYNIYRSTEKITETSGLSTYAVITNRDTSEYWDGNVISKMVYYYTVAAVDHAGNVSDLSDVVSAEVLADSTLPVVYKIEDNSAGVTLRDGDTLEIYVEAEPECTASFSIGDVIVNVSLTEDSRIGNYTGSYTIKNTDMVNDYIIVSLVDRSDNTATYAGDYKINIDGSTKTDNTPPEIESISEDSWSIAGFSGKLVAGDMLTVELVGEPGGVAYFNISDVVDKVRMTEDDEEPGKYVGTYTIQDGDYAEQTAIAGYLADVSGNVSSIVTPSKIDIDTMINIEVTPSQSVVPSDKKTRIDIVAKATNLNGDEISGHKIKFTLTTTDEYTGVVGSGRYTDFEDIVGGKLRVEWRGETDAFGEVNATYISGFAAKTTVILAKDLTSGDVGVGYITSFVSASVDITLIAQLRGVRRPRLAGRGVYIQVTATPEKLTADGESTSRIKARVTDIKGQPVSDEKIVFSISSDNGSLTALDQATDNRGMAEAVYTAGKQIGTVVVTALDTSAGINGSVMITLMSDAPAKVYIAATPNTLPADGKSLSDISISVSDINDNPNQGAFVEYEILKGRGRLDDDENRTDRNGEATNRYRAGSSAGTVTIQAKVTSRIPSEDEINRAKGTIFAKELYDGFESAEVKEWFKEVGDEIERGEPVVRISTEMGEFDITAKYTGKLYSIKKYEDDDFDIGETLGIIEIE